MDRKVCSDPASYGAVCEEVSQAYVLVTRVGHPSHALKTLAIERNANLIYIICKPPSHMVTISPSQLTRSHPRYPERAI